MSLLSDLKTAIKGKKTEHGERNAASSVLIQYGYTAQPEIEKRKQPDNSIVRIYTWYDTPAGDVCLITGPSVEGEIVQLNAPESYKAPQRVLDQYSTPRRNKKPKTIRRPAKRAFDHHEASIPHVKKLSPHALQPQSVRGNPIADEVKEVRALLTPIAKQYGQRISVRKGTGSMRGSVLVRGDHNATNPALRIAVLKALMNAGYASTVRGNDLAGLLSLSEEWNHAMVNFAVAQTSKEKSLRSNPWDESYGEEPQDVKDVRKLVQQFNKYGPYVKVREGFRDTEGMVNVSLSSSIGRQFECATQIQILKALAEAGYEPRKFYSLGFAVSKAEKNPISKFEMEQIGLTNTPYYKELESVEKYDIQTKKTQGESAKEIRALLKPIVKKYGQQVSVKQARGTGDVRVLAPIVDPAMHNEVVSVLKKAGYEGFGLDDIFTQDSINLSVSKSTPLRTNPKKGPQKKDLYSFDQYSPVPFGIQGLTPLDNNYSIQTDWMTDPEKDLLEKDKFGQVPYYVTLLPKGTEVVYLGDIVDSVAGEYNQNQLRSLAAPIVRAFLKGALGLKAPEVRVTSDAYLGDFRVRIEGGEFSIEQANLLREAFMIRGNDLLKSEGKWTGRFDRKMLATKPAQYQEDPYADMAFLGASGWRMPAKYANYVAALTASALKANNYELNTEGEQRLKTAPAKKGWSTKPGLKKTADEYYADYDSKFGKKKVAAGKAKKKYQKVGEDPVVIVFARYPSILNEAVMWVTGPTYELKDSILKPAGFAWSGKFGKTKYGIPSKVWYRFVKGDYPSQKFVAHGNSQYWIGAAEVLVPQITDAGASVDFSWDDVNGEIEDSPVKSGMFLGDIIGALKSANIIEPSSYKPSYEPSVEELADEIIAGAKGSKPGKKVQFLGWLESLADGQLGDPAQTKDLVGFFSLYFLKSDLGFGKADTWLKNNNAFPDASLAAGKEWWMGWPQAEKLSSQLGTNKGFMVRVGGYEYYAKYADNLDSQQGMHLISEHVANHLYRAMGIKAPDSRLGLLRLTGFGDNAVYRFAIFSPWLTDQMDFDSGALTNGKWTPAKDVENAFAVPTSFLLDNYFSSTLLADMLLENWDFTGNSYDNIYLYATDFADGGWLDYKTLSGMWEDSTGFNAHPPEFNPSLAKGNKDYNNVAWNQGVFRIDNGGALGFRAQGEKKPDDVWANYSVEYNFSERLKQWIFSNNKKSLYPDLQQIYIAAENKKIADNLKEAVNVLLYGKRYIQSFAEMTDLKLLLLNCGVFMASFDSTYSGTLGLKLDKLWGEIYYPVKKRTKELLKINPEIELLTALYGSNQKPYSTPDSFKNLVSEVTGYIKGIMPVIKEYDSKINFENFSIDGSASTRRFEITNNAQLSNEVLHSITIDLEVNDSDTTTVDYSIEDDVDGDSGGVSSGGVSYEYAKTKVEQEIQNFVEKLQETTPQQFKDLVSEVRGYLKSMLPEFEKIDSNFDINLDYGIGIEKKHSFNLTNFPQPVSKTNQYFEIHMGVSDLSPSLFDVSIEFLTDGDTGTEGDNQSGVSKEKAFAFVELELGAFLDQLKDGSETPVVGAASQIFSESQFGSYIDLSAPPNPTGDSTDPKNTNLTTLFDSVPFEPEMQPEIENQLGFPIIVPVTQGSLKFYTTSPSSPVQMFQIAFENDQYGVRRISQSGSSLQGFQTDLYTKSKEGKNLLYLIVGFSENVNLSKLKEKLNTYAKKKISAKKFIELTPEKIIEVKYPDGGAFGVNVGNTDVTPIPKPEMDAAGALFTDGYRVLLARRATNKGSTKNFTTSRGGQWALPGGKMDPGETAEQSALRETEEELGTLPKFTPLDITITTQTQTPSRLINYNTVMFYVDPTDADNYKPMIQGEHSWETDGWAWVPLDEFTYQTDSQGRIQTIWSPELHPGLGKPIEFADGVQSILSLVKTEMPNWKKAKFTVETGEVKGLPFKGIKPTKKNPSGYTMSGVRKSPMGGEYIEYRPRMPDGSRPRIRLSTGSPIVASQQVSTELRQYSKAKKLGVKYSSKAKVSVSDSLSRLGTFTVGGKMIWPASAMPKFAEAANALFGGKATPKSMFENQLLQIAGLPITEVIPSAVEVVEKIIEKPAKTIEELKYLPAGKGKLTAKQKKVVKELKKSLTDILGTKLDRYDQIGALDSQYASELKEKINWALSKKKGPNYNDENVAKYLRYLVEARQAGLWKTYLDPGDMVLFRNLDSSLNNDTPSEIEQTRLQIKAMQDAGFWPKGKVDFKGTTRNKLCAQWLMIQDTGRAYDFATGKTKKVNVGFVRYPQKKGYKKVDHDELEPMENGVNPAKEQLVIDQYASTPKVTHNKQYTLPSWANKPFANVEGFWVGWNAPSYKKYTGLRAESWSSNIEAYGSGSKMALMTRACWSDNFVLIPGKYPKGWDSPYVSEREVIAVYSDYEPIPVQVIRLKNSGAGSDFGVGDNFSLSKDMLQAYIAAHPPYQKGSKLDACPSQTKKKKNPSWSEADLIQFLSGGGDVTVRDLKYSFGGTSQSHTKRLQELVGRGILYYDNGKYGLTEDQSYRSNPHVGPENLVQVMDYDNGSTILVPALSVRYRSDVLLDEYGEPDKPSAKKVYAKDIPEFEMSHDTRGSALRAAQSYIDEYYVQDQYYY